MDPIRLQIWQTDRHEVLFGRQIQHIQGQSGVHGTWGWDKRPTVSSDSSHRSPSEFLWGVSQQIRAVLRHERANFDVMQCWFCSVTRTFSVVSHRSSIVYIYVIKSASRNGTIWHLVKCPLSQSSKVILTFFFLHQVGVNSHFFGLVPLVCTICCLLLCVFFGSDPISPVINDSCRRRSYSNCFASESVEAHRVLHLRGPSLCTQPQSGI